MVATGFYIIVIPLTVTFLLQLVDNFIQIYANFSTNKRFIYFGFSFLLDSRKVMFSRSTNFTASEGRYDSSHFYRMDRLENDFMILFDLLL